MRKINRSNETTSYLMFFLRSAAILACCSMTSVWAAASVVTLGLVDNGYPGVGLHSYTVTATGIGITTLSEFTITGDVYQVFDGLGNQSDWLGDGSASVSETTDSYVIFGDMRLPDFGGDPWDYGTYPTGPPTKVTLEIITGGGNSGLGTLNNSDAGPAFYDAYMRLSQPSFSEETLPLMQIVVEDGKGFSLVLKMLTSEGGDVVPQVHENLTFVLDSLINGDANGDGKVDVSDLGVLATHYGAISGATWADADFNRDDKVDVSDLGILATAYGDTSYATVPEPTTLSLLCLGTVVVAWRFGFDKSATSRFGNAAKPSRTGGTTDMGRRADEA